MESFFQVEEGRKQVVRWTGRLLLILLLAWPALAGRELDNRSGVYNGDYIADTIVIREPDKEEVVKKTVHIGIRERYVDIVWSPDKMDHCRIDSMYTTHYKTEITCHHTSADTRYFITVAGTIGPPQ